VLFQDPRLDTTIARASGGLVLASVVGAAATLLLIMAEEALRVPSRAGGLLPGGLGFYPFVLAIWLFGAFTVGALGWGLFHQLGLRGPLAAIVLGVAGAWLGGATFTGGSDGNMGLLLSLSGLPASLAGWRLAYRRAPRPEAETFS
jgi:hypothetical protein